MSTSNSKDIASTRADLGLLLRQTRESKELTLSDVEARVRIRQRYLAALEAGEWDQLPNEVVGRGFFRIYARFLDLNADDLLAKLDGKKPAASEPTTLLSPATAPSSMPADAMPAPAEPIPYRPIDIELFTDTSARRRSTRRLLIFALALASVTHPCPSSASFPSPAPGR